LYETEINVQVINLMHCSAQVHCNLIVGTKCFLPLKGLDCTVHTVNLWT